MKHLKAIEIKKLVILSACDYIIVEKGLQTY
jgi:hypothetical protein